MEQAKPFPIYQLMDAFEAFSHGEPAAKPQHRSLYYYLLGRARKLGNVPTYALPYENGMHGSSIGSWATYDAALKALAGWGFIEYTPGANRFKTPIVAILFRNPTDDVLLTYWQSYCLSMGNPTGDNKRLIELGKEVVDVKAAAAKLEKENSALQAELASLKAQLAPGALPALPAKTPKQIAELLTGDNDQFTADTVPMLNDPRLFGIVLARYGVGECDQAHYMREIRATCESKHMNAGVAQFESFIKSYFKNDAASRNGLVKPVATAQPMGQAANPMTFELNPAAAARRAAAEALNMQNIIAANLARINRKEGTNYTIGGMVGTVTPI